VSLIEEAIPARLEAVPAVTDLIGTRIYPTRAPEGVTRPFATFQRISSTRERAFGQNPGLAGPRFQITAWATTYGEAVTVANAIRQALERYRGTILGIVIQDVFVDTDQDLRDDEAQLYGKSTDFFVHHLEA
jgi:hypothetical protein